MAGKREDVKVRGKRKGNEKLLTLVRDRYKVMYEADDENRRDGMEDMKFSTIPGWQWDENQKQERDERPCYEFNKTRVFGKRVINEIRANRPQGKVRGMEGGDRETAEILDGLCRNIENISDFATVQDYAGEYQVYAGMAGWRVVTEYSDDTAFDQDIKIEPIKNPFCLYSDPSAQDVMKRDAEDWILTEKISRKAFETRYPDHEPIEFEADIEFDDDEEWEDEEAVRVAEYWYKEPAEKEICQLSDGKVIEKDSDEYEALVALAEGQDLVELGIIKKSRKVVTNKIMMCIASGDGILEGPTEWAGTEFPFVMIFGEYLVIDGKTYWWGLTRFAKDAQRSYNTVRTAAIEAVAAHPSSSKWWATAQQAEGNVDKWGEAHRQNFPFLIYNPDPKASGPPKRMAGADVPVALIQEAEIASQELRDVTGLHEASFGEESGEKSGIALARKQRQGAVVTYNYPDNMAKGVKRTWEILIDLIPRVYDTQRELRILGSDGAEDYKQVNQLMSDPDNPGEVIKINDLSMGKYDVTVTTGPSFVSQREEAAEVYGQLGQQFPQLMGAAGDLVMKSMDLPYSDDIADRLRTLLPPPIQEMLNSQDDAPPEVVAAMGQVKQAMQQVEEHGQLVQAASKELEEEQKLAEKTKAEIKVAISDLERRRAQLEAAIKGQMADLTLAKAEAVNEGLDVEMGKTRDVLTEEMQAALISINEMVSQFMNQSIQSLTQIQARGTPIVSTPRISRMEAKRENGKLIAVPVYQDEDVGQEVLP